MQKFEKIAIIGTAFRFPGADHFDDLDRIFSGQIDCVRGVSEKRKKLNGLDPDQNYAMGGYLSDIDEFDYDFFQISKAEAACMDPQLRMCLELSCEAFSQAGYSVREMRGSSTGVFLGGVKSGYENLFDDDTGFAGMGNMAESLAGRVAYQLDLEGEAMVTATACSSSLYAIYDACLHLQTGQCGFALAGGVSLYFNILNDREKNSSVNTLGLASPDGTCKTFDDRADGISLCEGAGIVLLRPYEEAVKAHDSILAVISGAGANQDGGRSASFTAPSAAAQAELFERVWDNIGLDPSEIGYYEAHGTGTRIGDPIEISSITRAMRKYTDRTRFCPVGSLKTNFAHPGYAAGAASVLKGILSIRRRKKYPLRDFHTPNQMIDFDSAPVYPITETESWDSEKRIFAINSFGATGTNVHMILENAPEPDKTRQTEDTFEFPVTVSARTAGLLQKYKSALAEEMDRIRKQSLRDVCYVLNAGRDEEPVRDAAVVRTMDELEQFFSRGSGESREGSATGRQDPGKLVLLCSADRPFSDREIDRLCRLYPVFRSRYRGMAGDASDERAKTIAANAALIAQWEAWGIRFSSMIGTESGNTVFEVLRQKRPAGSDPADRQETEKPFDEPRFIRYIRMMQKAEQQRVNFLDVSGGKLSEALKRAGKDAELIPGIRDGSLLPALVRLYQLGYSVSWSAYYSGQHCRRVALPAKPFLRTAAWPVAVRRKDEGRQKDSADNKDGSLLEFIRATWEHALGLEQIGDEDDVFDLGANSLASMSIVKKIYEKTGIELAFDDLYEYATVSDLCGYVTTLMEETTASGIKEESGVPAQLLPLTEEQKKEWLPVSGNQERMLVLSADAGSSAAYNMPVLYRITGPLNETAFRETWDRIIRRHGILRTVYRSSEGRWQQKILNAQDCPYVFRNAVGMPSDEIRRYLKQESARPFDLTKESPIRVTLVRSGDENYFCLVNLHHIASDGWSLAIFYDELETIYSGIVSGNENPIPVPKLQYADYACQEAAKRKNGSDAEEIAYWKQKLDGIEDPIHYPEPELRLQREEKEAGAVEERIDRETADRLIRAANRRGMSLFMVLESAYALTLNQYSGDADIRVGVPVSNRETESEECMIGYFSNTVAIRSRVSKEQTVEEFLSENKQTIEEALKHSRVPFDQVTAELEFHRSRNYAPLFQHLLAMQNFRVKEMNLPGISIRSEPLPGTAAKYDMTVTITEDETGILLHDEFDRNLFSGHSAAAFLRTWKQILETVLEDSGRKLSDLDLNSASEIISSENPSDSLF
jgi:3-oxoacyl-(acyl-carrier-protein) synthase/acyl carrier protein